MYVVLTRTYDQHDYAPEAYTISGGFYTPEEAEAHVSALVESAAQYETYCYASEIEIRSWRVLGTEKNKYETARISRHYTDETGLMLRIQRTKHDEHDS